MNACLQKGGGPNVSFSYDGDGYFVSLPPLFSDASVYTYFMHSGASVQPKGKLLYVL